MIPRAVTRRTGRRQQRTRAESLPGAACVLLLLAGRGVTAARAGDRAVKRRRVALLPAVALALLAGACRHDSTRTTGDLSSARPAAHEPAPAPTPLGEPDRLPEDPDAGARSSAEWRRHLQGEERERRLAYDRSRLPSHRAVVTILRSARRAYDHAATQRAVVNAQRSFRSTATKLDGVFDEIDHWGVSSKVLPIYRTLVTTLSDAYPKARVAALAGDTSELEAVRRKVDAAFAEIDAWLQEAAQSEDRD